MNMYIIYILTGKTRWSLSEMPLGILFTQHTPKMKRAAQEQALMDAANVGITHPPHLLLLNVTVLCLQCILVNHKSTH